MAETFRNVEFMTAAEQKTMWCDAMSGVVYETKNIMIIIFLLYDDMKWAGF